MLTEKDYCDYDTCVALKELGLSCDDVALRYEAHPLAYRYEDIPKPMLYEAQKWLRENHYLHITIFSSSQESWMYRITKPHQKLEESMYSEDFISYEDALLHAIKECIKLC